jgi:hypothetical protein
VGDVALVLRRKAKADVIAIHPTVTLFLPRGEFMELVEASVDPAGAVSHGDSSRRRYDSRARFGAGARRGRLRALVGELDPWLDRVSSWPLDEPVSADQDPSQRDGEAGQGGAFSGKPPAAFGEPTMGHEG